MDRQDKISQLCTKLRLGSVIPDMLPELDDNAQAIIQQALDATLQQRISTALLRRVKKSGLNPRRSFEGYEFGRFDWPACLPREEFLRLDFMRRAENVIMFGAPGTGKSHLANAIGLTACEQRFNVLFENTSCFVARLSEAYQMRKHNDLLRKLNRLDLLILDEFGYVPIDPIGAQLLFRVIGEFYENHSVILTTNLGFSEWNQIFVDPKLTESIVDRMIHHSHMIQFTGESYRVQHSLLKG